MAPSKMRLTEAADEFIAHCLARGLQPTTARTYRSALTTLVRDVGNIEVARLTARHLDQSFAKHNWQASSRNSRLAQYKGFFSWCRARGYMHRDSDPAFGWRNVRVPQEDRLRIPASEWGRLFAACEHPQERIVLATGLYLFLRASEQKGLQLKHINLNDGEILVRRTKTKQTDFMPISSELDSCIREHLVYMSEHCTPDPEHYLIGMRYGLGKNQHNQFIKGTGKLDPTRPLSRPHATVQRVLQRAGYPHFGEGQHTLRRSGARAYFDSLVDLGYDGALRRVQSMLGHSSAVMSERYLGLNLDRQQRNTDLKGKMMFPALQDAKIVPIREVM